MKVFVQHILASPAFLKARVWGKLITITGSTQVTIQVVSFISGVLVIRLLSTDEYALYTLANTMLGTIAILADGGVSTGIMALGGRVHSNQEKLGQVLTVGLDLRKKFTSVSFMIVVPIFLIILFHHGASITNSLLIILSIVPAVTMAVYGNLLEVVPKLKQDIFSLQKIQLGTSIGRLGLLSISIFALPWAFVAVLAAGLPQVWANLRLKKLYFHHFTFKQEENKKEIRSEILSIVKRMLPNSIFYCFYGQISVWLLSFWGATLAVAQIGALGRLSVIINLLYTLVYTLILPRFSRLVAGSEVVIKRYLQIQAWLLGLSISYICFLWIFSYEILWVIGQKYAGLTNELLLLMIGSCISFIAGVNYHLCTSKGWVISPLFVIPINIIGILIGTLVLDVSTLRGVLHLNIFLAVLQLIMNQTYIAYKFYQLRSHE